MACSSSSRRCAFVCSLWLWYILIWASVLLFKITCFRVWWINRLWLFRCVIKVLSPVFHTVRIKKTYRLPQVPDNSCNTWVRSNSPSASSTSAVPYHNLIWIILNLNPTRYDFEDTFLLCNLTLSIPRYSLNNWMLQSPPIYSWMLLLLSLNW